MSFHNSQHPFQAESKKHARESDGEDEEVSWGRESKRLRVAPSFATVQHQEQPEVQYFPNVYREDCKRRRSFSPLGDRLKRQRVEPMVTDDEQASTLSDTNETVSTATNHTTTSTEITVPYAPINQMLGSLHLERRSRPQRGGVQLRTSSKLS